MYQLMFAIITPALIVGAIAERMKYCGHHARSSLLWMFVVYFPLAHMVWGIDGFMNGVWNAAAKIKAIDFAGGTVVHMSSGWSALVLCLILGKRKGFGKRAFAAAQPGADHGRHRHAVGRLVRLQRRQRGRRRRRRRQRVHDHHARRRRGAGCTWPLLEWITRGKPTVLGFCSGAVAGLVVITPAAGFVTATGAVIIGVLAGVVPFLACTKLKGMLQVRRRARHLRRPRRRRHARRAPHRLPRHRGRQREPQHQPRRTSSGNACGSSSSRPSASRWCWRSCGTVVLALIVKAVIGLRPSIEDEEAGLDDTDHGEVGLPLRGSHNVNTSGSLQMAA